MGQLGSHLLILVTNYGEVTVSAFCKDKEAHLDYIDVHGRTLLCTAKRYGWIFMKFDI
jgi:hypothetical protein